MPAASVPPPTFDAVVLAGGRSARLGTPKAELVVGGTRLLDAALAAVRGARRSVVVGPPRLARPALDVVSEEPPFGGPVAGVAAGLGALGGDGAAGWVLLLACDLPRAAEAVPPLLDAVGAADAGVDGAYLVRDGRAQWLVGLYRRAALDARVAALAGRHGTVRDLPVRALVTDLVTIEVEDAAAASTDLDTWDDVERFLGGPRP